MNAKERNALLKTLQERFDANMPRHVGMAWSDVQARIEGNAAALRSLQQMEATGGEPDVVASDKKSGQVTFYDCSAESPTGRRSACHDGAALASRKANKPKHSAGELADTVGIEMLTEEQYRELQQLGEFDLKTSSWVRTPPELRALGGALFCDRRFGRVFTYHNGVESYYAGRGFRGLLRV